MTKVELIREYLCCPACKGELEIEAEQAVCTTCQACYLIVDNVMVLLPAVADEFAKRLRWRYEATSGGTSLPSVFRITAQMLGDVKDKVVLDVGCSQGQFAFQHLLAGARAVIGVDFAAGAIQVAQQRAASVPNTLFVVGDAMALPVKSDKFDRVIITEVIEHLPDVNACLVELRRVVRRDGEIILSTSNYFNLVGIFKRLFDRYHYKGRERWTYADHSEELEHFQTPFSVQGQFVSAGLRVVDFRGSDLWLGIRKALMVPWLVFDYGLRKLTARIVVPVLATSFTKYFGVVQYYRLKKDA